LPVVGGGGGGGGGGTMREGGYGKEHKSVLWALFYSPLPPVFLTTPVQLRLLQWPRRELFPLFLLLLFYYRFSVRNVT